MKEKIIILEMNTSEHNEATLVYLTIIPRARMAIDSEAMGARGIIVLMKTN